VLNGADHGAHLSHSKALAGLVWRALARLGVAAPTAARAGEVATG
jgi:hypothetical protein